jgi:hypothetical protein
MNGLPGRPGEYLVDEHGCWIWQMSRNSGGYGLKWSKEERRLMLAHRLYYQRVRGPIPDGLQIDHLCEVRACVNPQHLEAVTPRVHNARTLERSGYRSPPPREAPVVRMVDPGDCVLWQGCLDRDGYGAKWVDGKRVMVHRWAYEQVHGPIPQGLQIDHLCRNPACYRVDHLEVVTLRENNRRKWPQACKRGHAFTPENTAWQRDGRRKCRTCRAESQARYEQRRRERRRQDRAGREGRRRTGDGRER